MVTSDTNSKPKVVFFLFIRVAVNAKIQDSRLILSTYGHWTNTHEQTFEASHWFVALIRTVSSWKGIYNHK